MAKKQKQYTQQFKGGRHSSCEVAPNLLNRQFKVELQELYVEAP